MISWEDFQTCPPYYLSRLTYAKTDAIQSQNKDDYDLYAQRSFVIHSELKLDLFFDHNFILAPNYLHLEIQISCLD
jgi:hypothetical protein